MVWHFRKDATKSLHSNKDIILKTATNMLITQMKSAHSVEGNKDDQNEGWPKASNPGNNILLN